MPEPFLLLFGFFLVQSLTLKLHRTDKDLTKSWALRVPPKLIGEKENLPSLILDPYIARIS